MAHITVTGTIGIFFFAAVSTGYLVSRLNVVTRVLLLVASGLCIHPGWITDGVGIALGIAVYLFQRMTGDRTQEAPVSNRAAASPPQGG